MHVAIPLFLYLRFVFDCFFIRRCTHMFLLHMFPNIFNLEPLEILLDLNTFNFDSILHRHFRIL